MTLLSSQGCVLTRRLVKVGSFGLEICSDSIKYLAKANQGCTDVNFEFQF